MFIVHVKHYLTQEGLIYFDQWFSDVYFHMSKQKGFISVVSEILPDDEGVYIVVKFQDEETLMQWVAEDIHDELVHALDPYRSRDYWEVFKTDNEFAERVWEKIIIT